MTYIVTAAAAVVKPKGSPEVYRYRGAVVPADSENLSHLIDANLVGKIELVEAVQGDDPASTGEGDPNPLADRTLPELREYAQEHNIDLGGASRKDEVLAAIAAAEQA